MTLFWGIIFIATGLAARFFIGRRKFNRRNVAGIEEHINYSSALGNAVFDKIISITGFIVIALGIMLIATFFIQK